MRKFLSYFVLVSLTVVLIGGSLFENGVPTAEAAINRNLLCTDAGFTNYRALNEAGIQNFLVAKGSFLKDFSENGRRASRIIYNAAQENGISPITILAMIQKEEGLITGTHSKTLNQTRVSWAMGYGYTDSTIYTQYRGFTKQIDYGTWQLKRNYSYWATRSDSVWRVGRTMNIDGTNITFGNKCTSALYRYTPHLGTNFTYYFDLWGGNGYYNSKLFYQGPSRGTGAPGVALLPGQTFTAWASFKNTGTSTWYRNGLTPVHLGTSSPHDRRSPLLRGRSLRGYLVQSSVAPGSIGTFKIKMTAPSVEGTYNEHFQPVTENVGWMNADVSWTFKVSRSLAAAQSSGTYVRQGFSRGSSTLSPGQALTLWVSYRNTGRQTWFRDGAYATHLGMTSPVGRRSAFAGNTTRRGYLVQSQVAPGQIGVFKINLTAPRRRYLPYIEHFQLVTENVKWFASDVSFRLFVR